MPKKLSKESEALAVKAAKGEALTAKELEGIVKRNEKALFLSELDVKKVHTGIKSWGGL